MNQMKRLNEMTKEELAAYLREAISYCKENKLYRPGELERLSKDTRELMAVSIARMELHKKAHPL